MVSILSSDVDKHTVQTSVRIIAVDSIYYCPTTTKRLSNRRKVYIQTQAMKQINVLNTTSISLMVPDICYHKLNQL